jgi:hypothetical protein
MLKYENLVANLHVSLSNLIIRFLGSRILSSDFLAQLSIFTLALIDAFFGSMNCARNSLGHNGVRITSPRGVADIFFYPINCLWDPDLFERLPSVFVERFVAAHGGFVATHATLNFNKGFIIVMCHLLVELIEM